MNSITETSFAPPQVPFVASSTQDVQATLQSLAKLLEGDESEQRETFEYLKRVLDEYRPYERRLFA